MQLVFDFSFFLLGAVIASFAGVVAARLNTGQGFLTGRSRCDACGKELAPRSLFPIVSFVMSWGRAVCCGARISFWSPITEGVLGVLFVLSYHALGLSAALLLQCIALSLLLALVLYDFAHQILPTALLYPFVGVAILLAYVNDAAFVQTFLIASAIAGSLVLVHILSRGRAMGLADAPLAFGLSMLGGASAVSGFVFSFWIGAVIGIVLLARRPHGSRMNSEVPFAPFLAAGFLLAYFTQWNPFIFVASLMRF